MPTEKVTTYIYYDGEVEQEWEVEVTGTVRAERYRYGEDADGNRGEWRWDREVEDLQMEYTQKSEVISDAVFTSLESEAREALLEKWESSSVPDFTQVYVVTPDNN